MFWFKHANTRKHLSKHSWLRSRVILNILAHLAHLAQSYFSLIFSATNTYNCSQFDLTNKKSCSDWRQKLGEKWTTLTTFFLTATAAITGKVTEKKRNKVIRPKSRASALSKKVRQTDRQTFFFFKKTF